MSRTFKVGDKVRVNCPGSPHHGVETVVISRLRRRAKLFGLDGVERVVPHYNVALVSFAGFNHVGFEPHELIPLYDGNEKVAWSACEWQPLKVRA